LTTVVVGGGPTGVEIASAIAALAGHALARDFRRIDPRAAEVLLIEAGPRVHSGFPDALSDYSRRTLQKLGVTVLTNTAVDNVEAHGVSVGGRFIPAGTIVWGAGVKASPAAHWLGVEPDRAGRIPVGSDLAVPELGGVYALGDTAAIEGASGKTLPALAQVAHQEGRHLGRALRENLLHGTPIDPFRFKDRGNTAIIGRNAAVFDFGRWQLKGRLGWLLWAIVHVYLLTGFDKRLLVTMQWLWRYLTYERGARLILASTEAQASNSPVAHDGSRHAP
jgi:NADH dehydrogenase